MAAKKQTPAKVKSNQLPAVQNYGEFAGRGYQNTDADDFALPYLAVLQDDSPQCDKDDEGYLKEAKPGMLLNTATQQLYDGTVGVTLVPCVTEHVWIEWVKRKKGGGLVGRHDKYSDTVREAKARSSEFGTYETEDGHDLVQTYYMYALLLEDEDDDTPSESIVLACVSSKIKPYKKIMTQLRGFKSRPPLFANRVRLTVVPDKNKVGDKFFNIKMVPAKGDVETSLIPAVLEDLKTPHPLLEIGAALEESIVKGTRGADDAGVRRSEGSGEEDDLY